MHIVGTRVTSVDNLPVRTVVASDSGMMYVHHSPGRWRNGTTGEEARAAVLNKINPVVVFHPDEGLPRPETVITQEAYDLVFDLLKRRVVDSATYSYLGFQVMDILTGTEDYLRKENLTT